MTPVDLGGTAFWLLLVMGALSGLFSLWTFRHLTDSEKLRTAINRIIAHLMEFHLFSDEPALILKAQYNLLVANARFLKIVALPSLLLIVPFAALLIGAEAVFGHAPLRPGEATVVTAHTQMPDLRLEAPVGISVETVPVRIPFSSEVSWRIRPKSAAIGLLRLSYNDRSVTKSISSKSGLQWLSEKRSGSLASFLMQPFELPFNSPGVQSVAFRYPAATVLHMHWLVWFLLGSFLGFSIPVLFFHHHEKLR